MGECEDILKKKYNINKNETFIILKLDYFLEGTFIPLIKYDIFNPITKKKLDLNYCNNIKSNNNIPVIINEESIYLHDPDSGYYKDICASYSTDSETDITLFDRKNQYNINNMSLCERNCKFIGYNSITKKALCSCNINNNSPLNLEDIINSKKLLNNFINFKSISNIGVMKCYHLLFSKNGIINNAGSYLILFIIFVFIISSIIFKIKEYKSFNNKIINIIEIKKEIKQNNNISEKNDNFNNDFLNMKSNKKRDIKINEHISQIRSANLLTNLSYNKNKKDNNELVINQNSKLYDSTINYVDLELNTLPYKEAIEEDKRTYFQYYIHY